MLGRRTFEVGLPEWNDTPYPAPAFVVTHRPRHDLRMSTGTFTFVGTVDEAVERARQAAGDRVVALMGGDIAQQALSAGMVDQVHLQTVPLLSVPVCGSSPVGCRVS